MQSAIWSKGPRSPRVAHAGSRSPFRRSCATDGCSFCYLARVERVEPPRFFSFRWARPNDTPPVVGNSTLVEFSLSAEGEGTKLKVVESGFAALAGSEDEKAQHFADNTEGWNVELGHLRDYAAKAGSR